MSRKKKHKRRYEVRKDAEWMAPGWLSVRIDGQNVKLLYHIIDGAVQMKGVKVNHEVAKIGDVIIFDGKRLSVERGGDPDISHLWVKQRRNLRVFCYANKFHAQVF